MAYATNLEAAQSGDVRAALETARDTAAAAIDAAMGRGDGTVAQLMAQYRATIADLVALDAAAPPQGESDLDRIRARRAATGG